MNGSNRRRFLRAIGAGTIAGLAGCADRGRPIGETPSEGSDTIGETPSEDSDPTTEDSEAPPSGVAFPGLDSIGFSYDVFRGQFASPESTRMPLFELGDPVEFDTSGGLFYKPETVRVQWIEDARITATSGTQASDYQRNLATQVGLEGGYGFFKGSLDFQFNELQRRSTVYNFVTQTDQYDIALLTLDPDVPITELLRERAATDLETADPTVLFDRYGTHYLHSLIVGAAATYSAATNTTKYNSEVDFAVAAEMSYRGVTGQLSANQETQYSEAIEEFRKASTVKVHARGGQAEFAGKIVDGSYDDWRKSIRQNLVFVSLNADSLRPLWDLCEDETRRARLEAAYKEYSGGFAPEPDPTIAPVYGYSTDSPRRWYFSLSRSDLADGGWRLHDEPFFHVSTVPGGERVPVYRHSAPNPIRYKLSVEQRPGHGWSDETEPVWYAYPPNPQEHDGVPGREGIYGFVDPNNRGTSGWFYNVRDGDRGWDREELTFYADDVDGSS